MGLSPRSTSLQSASAAQPLIARQPSGIIDPNTGKPVGADDPYFLSVNRELSDKGFFVAASMNRTWPLRNEMMAWS